MIAQLVERRTVAASLKLAILRSLVQIRLTGMFWHSFKWREIFVHTIDDQNHGICVAKSNTHVSNMKYTHLSVGKCRFALSLGHKFGHFLQHVRMAERSKAPDSRYKIFSYIGDTGVLVHVCGRGFKSHFWQQFFLVLLLNITIKTRTTNIPYFSAEREHGIILTQFGWCKR